MREAEIKFDRSYTAGFEDRGCGHEPRNSGSVQTPEEVSKCILT